MTIDRFERSFLACFDVPVSLEGRYVHRSRDHGAENQDQTNAVFSDKWSKYDESETQGTFYAFQRNWYLALYGFGTEAALRAFFADKTVIFDAGCGLGYKAAWFAELAPHAVVIGMDYSEAAELAADRYAHLENLFFVRGDIANTGFCDGAISYTSCDQVIMHTENPEATFAELARVTDRTGEVACYFYAKKALPRELLDDHFRIHCKDMSTAALWEMSEQLTELGKRLSDLNVTFEAPDIPELGIKGGTYDIQRFIYWNFLKCFWNAELGQETSVSTNFDWYSPSNARRFSKEEVQGIVANNAMVIRFFHSEDAAHSGRFAHG
jgi:ubiquinone/menaquinone biosynthesis C-methylase UbiE